MKRTTLYILALFCITFAGCQKDETVNKRIVNDKVIKYVASMGQQAQTRSDAGAGNSLLFLSDADKNIKIPMEWTAVEGIGVYGASAVTVAETKGELVNTTGNDNKVLSEFSSIVTEFVSEAYDSEGTLMADQTVAWSATSGAWTATPAQYWPQATTLGFFAFANLPAEQTAEIASTGVSMSHSVPATAAEQTDILFGHYLGDGSNTGIAEIQFEHPLTAVRFLHGEIDEGLIIKSIELDGVAETGTATMDIDGTVSWSDVGDHDYTVSQTGTEPTGLALSSLEGSTAELIGETFIIIPQNLASESVTVTVTFTTGQTVEATLDAGQWKAGYTNTYTISTDLTTTVIVSVDDEVDGSVKSDLVVANVGTSAAFMRVALVGFWVNSDNDIAGGWDMGQGEFADFPGTDWALGDDGFYYYTYPVRGATPDPVETGTKLFSTYTAPEAPVEDATLELNIIVQGVQYDHEKAGVSEAWGDSAAGLLNAAFKEE